MKDLKRHNTRTTSILIALLIMMASEILAQIPTGTFRTHASYREAIILEIVDDKIYCASNQGLFSYDLTDNSIDIFSRLDGLNDAGISAMDYIDGQKLLVIGYSNGSIDFVTDDFIRNNSVIKNAGVEEDDKRIYNIIHNNLIYLSTGIGVVVVDLLNFNIKENYQEIGPGGQSVKAYQVAFYNDSIFVASDLGILYAPFNVQTNLKDFNSWGLISEADFIPGDDFKGIISYGQGMVAYTDSLIYYYDGNWQLFDYQPDQAIIRINLSGNELLINLEAKIVRYDNGSVIEMTENIQKPQFSLLYNNQVWVADYKQGLVKTGASAEVILPNGPYSSSVFRVHSGDGYWLVCSGGYDNNTDRYGSGDGFYFFSGQQWKNFHQGLINFPPASDLTSSVYIPKTSEYFFSSFGDGLVVWDGEDGLEVVDDSSPGSTLFRNNEGDILISDVALDYQGNLLVLNYNAPTPLHIWDGKSQWESYAVNEATARYALKAEPTENGDIWMIIDGNEGGGIVVFNPESQLWRRLSSSSGNGGLPDNRVHCLAYDQNGTMWVGTERGIAFFPEPSQVLDQQNGSFISINASYPIVNNSFLLQGKKVLDIKIDGGQRKWIASNDGAWLVSENADQLFIRIQENNSILPSDLVLAIGIDQVSGEVLLATDRGMVSYRADATKPARDFSSVKIFPNPVDPGYEGVITISGLVDNAYVKITDVNGQLVYETRSFGGTATWNLSSSPNVKLSTGIYLVYSMDDEISQKFVGKIAIVR